jgi:hypothetical protein
MIANNDLPLVFVAAQLALDGDVSTFSEAAGQFSRSAEGDASMPFGPGFPRPSIVLPRRFGCERKHCDVRRVGDLLFGIAAEETDESDSVEVHTFLLFCPLSRPPGSEWARLPRPEAAFLGGPARGSQNRDGAEGKAEASQEPGAA